MICRLIPEALLDHARLAFRDGIVLAGPVAYHQDGLAVQHHAPFMADERFLRAYAAGEATGSWGGAKIHWRAHIACWAADQVKELPGDFIEFGVNRGGLAQTIIDYLKFESLKKTYYLLDTFNGLDQTLISAEERRLGRGRIPYYDECYAEVARRFNRYPFVRLVRGSVPSTLDQVDAEAFSFVSLDLNCAAPELAALEFCWPKLSPGGIIVLDDFAYRTHEAQQRMQRDFAYERGVPLLMLPTGQGLIMKPYQ